MSANVTPPHEDDTGKLAQLLGSDETQASVRPPLTEMPVREIERASNTQAAANIVLATLAVLVVAYFAKLVLITLLVSVLFAFMLEPAVSLLERFRMPRALCTGIVMMILPGGR